MAKKKDTQTQELFTQPVVPKMPEGYYSGDKPNLNLRAFVEQHLREKPYDSANDDYDVPAFNDTISIENRRDPINDLHIYWSKKPYKAVCQYVRHFTQAGDLVLDPFCGSGGTALAALMEDRKAIAIDRSPSATFITRNYCTPVDLKELEEALRELETVVGQTLRELYSTKCHETDKPATISYTVYSQVFECPRCLNDTPLFDCPEQERPDSSGGKSKTVSVCPCCLSRGQTEEIDARSKKKGVIPVFVSYLCEHAGKQKRGERHHQDKNPKAREYFKIYDLAKLKRLETEPIPFPVPNIAMLNHTGTEGRWGLLWRPYLSEVKNVADFFTTRNLRALACLKSGIEGVRVGRERLWFLFSGLLYNASKMYRERDAGGGPSNGTYYLPPVYREVAVSTLFTQKAKNLAKAADYWSVVAQPQVVISTQSAISLQGIPNDSVDYVFTDPPYSWKVQYGESNFLWEAWLGFDTSWQDEEIIVNDFRGKSEKDWAAGLKAAMAECFRVLKPGRWLSLCYHDTSEGSWQAVQDLLEEVGFVPDRSETALSIETGQKSWKQGVSDKITKRDLLINFRKPKPGEERSAVQFTGAEDQQSFREKAQTVIREYLQANPGATKDRIYDQVVSRLVRRGQMEAHNFDELLGQVAEEVKEEVKKNLFENEEPDLLGTHQISRWHLKESEAGADGAEQATTDSAGTRIHEFLIKTTAAKLVESEPKVSELQAEIAARRTKLQAVDQNESDESRGKLVREIRELKEKLDKLTAQRSEWQQLALDYSQIFEFYVAAVNPKPKARLEEILEDYCYQTDAGNWRPPLTEQEKLEKGSERQQAVRRKIQRFCKLLEAGDGIPAAQRPDAPTLAAWIRHCRRTGSHTQGKLLYERGGDLSTLNEQAQVDVEEDYQVCVKHLERGKK